MAKRPAASTDDSCQSCTKRVPPAEHCLTRLAQAGREKFNVKLQFDVVSTDKQARLLVVGCRMFHWHPPAGFLSRTRCGEVHAASQVGGSISVCVTGSRACHVTSHTVFVWRYTAFDTLCSLFTLAIRDEPIIPQFLPIILLRISRKNC